MQHDTKTPDAPAVLSGVDADAAINDAAAVACAAGAPMSSQAVSDLLASIEASETDPIRQARRINAELVPALAALEPIEAAAVIDVVCGKCRFLKRTVLDREVATARKARASRSPAGEGSKPADAAPPDGRTDSGYELRGGEIFREVMTPDGPTTKRLANFHARIVEEVVLDDGSGEEARYFVLSGALADRLGGRPLPAVRVPSRALAGMGWVNELWGAAPNPTAGQGAREHLRAAIQDLSGVDIPTRYIFRHLGWRNLDGRLVFLHATGGIGPDGTEPGVDLDLSGSMARFKLPDPPEGAALVDALRASLRMLDVAPHRLTMPIHAAIWRAVLGDADFSLHLTGATGRGKSELAALAQRHFGPGMDARNLPAAWSSTANALEAIAFLAKDCLLVVDDFAPSGAIGDRERYHREAERFFRAVGNAAGRSRLNSEAKLRAERPPRCLPLSTGEDLPGRLASLRARIIGLEVDAPIDFQRLTPCQEDAAAGVYAGALSGFLRWLAPRIATVKAGLDAERNELAASIRVSGHARVPRSIASLAVGFRWFLVFAREAGAIDAARCDDLWTECLAVMVQVGAAQAALNAGTDPVVRFLELLAAALVSGRAHVASPAGTAPDEPGRWGWRAREVHTGYPQTEWDPQGRRIGWVAGDDLYLEPDAAYQVAQEAGSHSGTTPQVGPRTLWKRCHEAGYLQATDANRETLKVRRTLESASRSVLCFSTGALGCPEENPTNPTFDGDQTLCNVGFVGKSQVSSPVPSVETHPDAALPEVDIPDLALPETVPNPGRRVEAVL